MSMEAICHFRYSSDAEASLPDAKFLSPFVDACYTTKLGLMCLSRNKAFAACSTSQPLRLTRLGVNHNRNTGQPQLSV